MSELLRRAADLAPLLRAASARVTSACSIAMLCVSSAKPAKAWWTAARSSGCASARGSIAHSSSAAQNVYLGRALATRCG